MLLSLALFPAVSIKRMLNAQDNGEDTGVFDLTGKTILVTGASKGIGASIVEALGRQGANVVAHYGSDRAGAEAATASIPKDRLPPGGGRLRQARRRRGACGATRWPGTAASTCSSTTRP